MELAQNTAAVRAQTVQSVQIDLRNQLDFSLIEAEVSTKSPDERTAAEALMRGQYFFKSIETKSYVALAQGGLQVVSGRFHDNNTSILTLTAI
jgi:hypothetical protein